MVLLLVLYTETWMETAITTLTGVLLRCVTLLLIERHLIGQGSGLWYLTLGAWKLYQYPHCSYQNKMIWLLGFEVKESHKSRKIYALFLRDSRCWPHLIKHSALRSSSCQRSKGLDSLDNNPLNLNHCSRNMQWLVPGQNRSIRGYISSGAQNVVPVN